MVRKNSPEAAAASLRRARERSRQWYFDNYDRARTYHQGYYEAHREDQLSKAKAKRLADPAKMKGDRRRWTLMSKYGLTPEQVEALIDEQKGRCAICRRPLGVRPIIDHDHRTNLPRGILCWNCNIALGHFDDDILRLEAAIAYLEVYQELNGEVYG